MRAARTPAERHRLPEYRAATRSPASRRAPGGYAMAGIPATPWSTWPTGCATAVGRCPPAPSPVPSRHRGPAHRGPPRREPGPGLPAPGRLPGRGGRFRRHAVAVSMTKEVSGGLSHLMQAVNSPVPSSPAVSAWPAWCGDS
jgi:hypothetical protein